MIPTVASVNKYKSTTMANILNSVSRWAVPAAIALSIGQLSIYDVKGGSRAVIFDRLSGVKENVINEGTHFLIPWLQKAVIYDVRTKPRNISTTTGSKDLQMVSLTLRVLHRPEVKMLPKIYQVCDSAVSLKFLICDYNLYFLERTLIHDTSPSASTTTNESSRRSATKSSNPSSPNSTPPN